jgi:hypothetical protein
MATKVTKFECKIGPGSKLVVNLDMSNAVETESQPEELTLFMRGHPSTDGKTLILSFERLPNR